jgi:hypothetical protein
VPATRVLVGRDGSVVVEGVGYSGSECLEDLEGLLRRLREKGVEVKVVAQKLAAPSLSPRSAARSSSS